jgi:DNA polymerase-3 subunit delta|tara:strand:+ start:24 stop:1010 length:987 start_codon:yes stop_codon:yes gene_type:complete
MIYKSYLIEQNLKKISENFVLFYGENLGLKNEFKKKIKSIEKEIIIIRLNQDEIVKNKDNFFNELLNLSLFEKKKYFLIENTNDKILPLIEEIIPKLDQQKVFLFSEILDKKSKLRNFFEKSKDGAIVPCYPDNEISLKKIIQDKLIGFVGLNTENINLILESCNLDRSKLYNELDKIVVLFKDKKIDIEDLSKLLNQRVNEDFDLIKDAALSGKKNVTNKLLSDTIIEEEKTLFYINNINNRLNRIKDILSNNNKSLEKAIESVKPPIFWKDKPNFLIQAKKWNLKKISNILQTTFDLEIQFKSQSILNKNILVKKLLVDICNVANA